MLTRLRSNLAMVAGMAAMVLAVCAPSTKARFWGGDVVPATSEHDSALTAALVQLSPSVNPDEARRVAFTAYTTGRQLAAEWRMVRPATMQSFLIHVGARKAGHCYQYANELLLRLDALTLRTLDLHWAECAPGNFDEHNVIAVTARGQPFDQGILLDNWRHSGRLVWGPVKGDPPFRWEENKAELSNRLQHPRHYSRIIPHSKPERHPTPAKKVSGADLRHGNVARPARSILPPTSSLRQGYGLAGRPPTSVIRPSPCLPPSFRPRSSLFPPRFLLSTS